MNHHETQEWHKIGNKLAEYLGICSCQRKLKSIIDTLYNIHQKVSYYYSNNIKLNFTGAELLVIALLDGHTDFITHGTNIEYPIIIKDHEFWKWIIEIKDSPYLTDN